MEYTDLTLPSGAHLRIESSRLPPPPAPGIVEATGASARAMATWDDGVRMVAEMAEQAMAQLRKATANAKEVSVEFGVNISGKTGIILVEGTVAANLKVTLKW
jgi:hypothetical protein